jgi:hypothetical protein
MSKLLYKLEDHFDDLADQWQGYFMGRLSLGLRGLCALVGDCVQPHGATRR